MCQVTIPCVLVRICQGDRRLTYTWQNPAPPILQLLIAKLYLMCQGTGIVFIPIDNIKQLAAHPILNCQAWYSIKMLDVTSCQDDKYTPEEMIDVEKYGHTEPRENANKSIQIARGG